MLRRDGVRWLVLGDSVTERVLDAASRYPPEAHFYESLTAREPAFEARSDSDERGRRWVRVYRIYPGMERRRPTIEALALGTAVFLSGAALLGVEIAASRVLAPTFGSSLYVWGALIGVVLTGLAIGYWAGGVVADRWPSPYLFVGAIASARCSCSRSPSSTSGSSSRSSRGIPGRGSTRLSRRSSCSAR